MKLLEVEGAHAPVPHSWRRHCKIACTATKTNRQPIDCEAQLSTQLYKQAFAVIVYKPSKLGQTDLFFGFDHSSSVGFCLRDYQSLVSVMSCATLPG